MPGFIQTANSVILCAHGGKVTAVALSPRVKVMGAPVILQPPPLTVGGCANPPPPVNLGPCVTVTFTNGSVRVKTMGMPMLLQDGIGIAAPTGTPASIVPTQVRVKAM